MSNAKYLVWSGEEQAYTQEIINEEGKAETVPAAGPSFMKWNGLRFDKGKPTLVDPAKGVGPEMALWEHILKKAPNMKGSFKVLDVGDDGEPVDPDDYEEVDEPDDSDADAYHEAAEPVHAAAPRAPKPKKKVRKRK